MTKEKEKNKEEEKKMLDPTKKRDANLTSLEGVLVRVGNECGRKGGWWWW
jgi:hypothetical protein